MQYKLEHQCSHIVLLAGGPYSGLSRSTIHNHVVSELGAPYAEQNKASFGEVHCLRLTLSNHYHEARRLAEEVFAPFQL